MPTDSRRPAGLPSIFTYTEAKRSGLSDRRLYQLRDEGILTSLGGGLYRWDGDPVDLNLVEIAHRLRLPTLCLETALARHDLIDNIPAGIDVAIPRGTHRPRLAAPVRLHLFSPHTFELGREALEVVGARPLAIYSAERSVIDMVRLRHREGSDLAWTALRRWIDRPDAQPGQLLTLARQFKGAERPLREALEVML